MTICIRAIDGGGNGFRRADVWGTGELVDLKPRPPVETAEELLDFVFENLPAQTIGVAYALAGVIENHNKVIKSPNIHLLDGVLLGDLTKKRLEKHNFPRNAVVCNDMEGAVAGMATLLPDLPYFLGITWSSGIGLRVWFERKIMVLEVEGGHIPLDPSPFAPRCGCEIRGCAESILGGKAIRRRVTAETEALGIPFPGNIDPSRFLDERFDKGEEWAVNIYDMISTGMATFLANLQSLLHLPAVVWKGTFAKYALPRIEGEIRRKMRAKLINPSWEEEMKFYFSPQPETDALIGAAAVLRNALDD